MSKAWIGIGCNLGDARVTFDRARNTLRQDPRIHSLDERSGIYRTRPVGAQAGTEFSNAVFSVTISLSPDALLDVLQDVETKLGRTHELRWGPRVVDLDLLFVDQIVINQPRLSLPHPGAWYRRFVLDPLVEMAQGLVHPLIHETVGDLRRRLKRRPFVVGLDKQSSEFVLPLRARLAEQFCEVQFKPADDWDESVVVGVHLDPKLKYEPTRNGIPLADLTVTPGDALQRIIDFCTAATDEPIRISDW